MVRLILYLGFIGLLCLFAFSQISCTDKPSPNAPKPQLIPQKTKPSLSPIDSLLQVPQTHVEIATPLGKIVVALYPDTPLHREQFLQNIQENRYNGTAFHRVIDDLMIQGGDPKSKDVQPLNDGTRDTSYNVASEILPYRFHKRGALGAIRLPDTPQGKDEMQFYIISASQPIPNKVLKDQEQQIRNTIGNSDFHFTEVAQQTYLQHGGAPWLDMQFTVFGEVVQGFEVLDRLSNLDTPRKLRIPEKEAVLIDRPRNIRQTRMKMQVLGDFKQKNGQLLKIEPNTKLNIE